MGYPRGLSEEEFIRREKLLQEATDLFEKGFRVLVATLQDGSTRRMRLFKSNSGSLGVYAKGRKRWGYSLQGEVTNVASFAPVRASKEKSGLDRHLDSLKKFKRLLTKAHPNLWKSLQDGYARLDLEEYEAFVLSNWESKDTHGLWQLLSDWEIINGLDLITENHYKTTTIRSNAPDKYRGYGWTDYNACLANIKRHLDNCEDFHYSWRGNYDVTVSGNVGSDGKYRAWLSLEYKGCGNGHYYALINENTAVFLEDD